MKEEYEKFFMHSDTAAVCHITDHLNYLHNWRVLKHSQICEQKLTACRLFYIYFFNFTYLYPVTFA